MVKCFTTVHTFFYSIHVHATVKSDIGGGLKWQYLWHMGVKCEVIYLDGLMWDCCISRALAMRCCGVAPGHQYSACAMPDWQWVAISMVTLYLAMKLSICVALMWQYVWHEYHMYTYISQWLCAGLQYLPCVSNRDTVVLHRTIGTVHGQWPGAWLAPGQRLYLWWHYVYPWN